jgi:hypothetical protein
MVEKIIEDFMTIYESSWSFSISLSNFYKKGESTELQFYNKKKYPQRHSWRILDK